MRELRLRVFDKQSREYVRPDYGLVGFCYPLDGRVEVLDCNGDILPNCIIEQYTGLKDKNGKEIYEGDIIQEEIDFNSKMTDGVFTYVVEWDSDTLCYGLRGDSNSIHDELWEVNASVEIIGNVHENPELLEEEE